MTYREIRVRPVVRYIVTDYTLDDTSSSSVALGEFDNAAAANRIGALVAGDVGQDAVFEPARQLRIDWLRGPGEPKEAIRWELSETEPPPAISAT